MVLGISVSADAAPGHHPFAANVVFISLLEIPPKHLRANVEFGLLAFKRHFLISQSL